MHSPVGYYIFVNFLGCPLTISIRRTFVKSVEWGILNTHFVLSAYHLRWLTDNTK